MKNLKIRLSILMCLLCLVAGKVGAESITFSPSNSYNVVGSKGETFTIEDFNNKGIVYQAASTSIFDYHDARFKMNDNGEAKISWANIPTGYIIKITGFSVTFAMGDLSHSCSIYSSYNETKTEMAKRTWNRTTYDLPNSYIREGGLNQNDYIVVSNGGANNFYIYSMTINYTLTPITYTITFDANGGVIPDNGNMGNTPAGHETSLADDKKSGTVKVTYDSRDFHTMTSDTPTYSDFIFDGWWTEDNVQVYDADGVGMGTYWADETWSHAGNVTLKAHWKEKANMKIGSSHFGTFCAPFDVTAPEGVKIYKEIENKTDIIRFQSQDDSQVIPAYTPVIVYSEGTVDEDFYGTIRTQDNCSYATLSGNLAPARAAENGSYVLNSSTEKPGVAFKIVDTNVKAVNVLKNRCYIPATKAAKLNSLSISLEDGEGTTFISDFSKLFESEISTIHSASGIQLPSMQKGMNIVKYSDGSIKKVFVK